LFGHAKERTLEARRFWAEQVGTKEALMAVNELEEYYEAAQKFFDLLPPEKRVAGLSSQELLPVLPDDVLRALSEDFVEHLPEPTRSAVRKRRQR
jgi:hypothetical protein